MGCCAAVLATVIESTLASAERMNSQAPAAEAVRLSAAASKRTFVMVANDVQYLAAGSAIIAVGAMHLPGPEGLVELFRKAGYTVSPAG